MDKNEMDLIELEKIIKQNFEAGECDPELAYELMGEYDDD